MTTKLSTRGSSIALLIAVCAAVWGCAAPVTWTETKAADPLALATVSGDWEGSYKIYIIKVDQHEMRCSKLSGMTQTVRLVPGQHTLFVGYENQVNLPGAYGDATSHAFKTIDFLAETGKRYAIHRRIDGYQTILWLQRTS